MGQFSWIYADTDKQVVDGKYKNTYLLVPKPFQDKYGKSILERRYNGYGDFGKYDIYDLVAEWNKEMIPEIVRRIKKGNWKCSTDDNDILNLQNYYEGKPITCELRWLGILMACYDEDNFALEYPIKITEEEMDYEKCKPSLSDPNQGWEYYDEDDEDMIVYKYNVYYDGGWLHEDSGFYYEYYAQSDAELYVESKIEDWEADGVEYDRDLFEIEVEEV